MVKLVLLIIVGFLLYNWYIRPMLNPPRVNQKPGERKRDPRSDDDYTDYEELR
jgi:hypothetical protein